MKFNKLVKLAVLAATVATSANAMADAGSKFYVGGDLNYTKLKFSRDVQNLVDNLDLSAKKKRPGLGLFAGVKMNECLGFEVGTVLHKKIKLTGNNIDGSAKLYNVYVDANGYYSVADNVQLIGSIGGSLNAGKVRIDDERQESATRFGGRIGAGVQYNIDNVGIRAMLRHSRISQTTGFKSANSASLGVLYSF
jgi:opacity protein-like surface antigen